MHHSTIMVLVSPAGFYSFAAMSEIQKGWYKQWFNSPYYYTLYKNRNTAEAENFVAKLVQYLQLPSNTKVLDVACGKGRHSVAMAAMNLDVVGVDLSEEAIKEAQTQAHAHLQFFIHDMRLPFWVNYFEVVVNLFTSFGYFNTQREHQNALRTMCQALKPGGKLVIDYLNFLPIVQQLPAEHSIEEEGIQFHIKKWSNTRHIIKNIEVNDGAHKHSFTEQVAIFSLQDFESMLSAYQVQIIAVFGNYQLQPFHADTSDRLIIIAEKQRL